MMAMTIAAANHCLPSACWLGRVLAELDLVGLTKNHETGNPARCSDSVREHKLSTGAAHRSLKFTSAPDGVNRLKEPPVISHTKER